MNIEINTDTKVIKVKGTVNLKELFTWLNNAFPDFAWMEWQISEYPQPATTWKDLTTWEPQLQPYVHNPGIMITPYIGDPHIPLTETLKWGTGGPGSTLMYSGGNTCSCEDDLFKTS